MYGSVVPLLRVQSNRTDLASAIANNSFFTITVNPQQPLNLSLLTLNASNGATTYPWGLAIRSSVTGDTNLEHITLTGGQTTPQLLSIDLGSYGEFQNLTSSVTFTFYLYNASNINTQNFIVDNIAFSGSTVPEPSVVALSALGAIGLLAWKRRRSAGSLPISVPDNKGRYSQSFSASRGRVLPQCGQLITPAGMV